MALSVGVVTGALVVQRRGVYSIMLTLAFANMFFFVVSSWGEVTGGENGLLGVAHRPLQVAGFRLSIEFPTAFYIFSAGLLIGTYWLLQRIVASPFGSVLVVDAEIREVEDSASIYRGVGESYRRRFKGESTCLAEGVRAAR